MHHDCRITTVKYTHSLFSVFRHDHHNFLEKILCNITKIFYEMYRIILRCLLIDFFFRQNKAKIKEVS